MIFKAYYNVKPFMGCIRISQLKDGLPAEYSLAVVHEINGLLVKKKLPNYESAVNEASSYGCAKSKWELTKFEE